MATFIKIFQTEVGAGGASSIDFNTIPSTYTDLLLKVSGRSSDASNAQGLLLAFNGSSSSFTYKLLEGNGSAAASYSGSTGRAGGLSAGNNTSNTFGSLETYIPNYAGSSNKSFSTDSVSENNSTIAYADLTASLWSNTAAINRITLTFQVGNFVQYSTATLYGIKNS